MSYEDAAILAAFTVILAVVIALLPRGHRKGALLERPQAQALEFDPLVLDADGPVLDLKAA